MKTKIFMFIIISTLLLSGCHNNDANNNYYSDIYFNSSKSDCDILKIATDAKALNDAELFKENMRIEGYQGGYLLIAEGRDYLHLADTTTAEPVMTIEYTTSYDVYGSYFYYLPNDSRGVHCLNLITGDDEKLLESSYSNIYLDETGAVWLIDSYNRIYKYSGSGQVSDAVAGNAEDMFAVRSGQLYYSSRRETGEYDIINIDIASGQSETIYQFSESFYGMSVLNDNVNICGCNKLPDGSSVNVMLEILPDKTVTEKTFGGMSYISTWENAISFKNENKVTIVKDDGKIFNLNWPGPYSPSTYYFLIVYDNYATLFLENSQLDILNFTDGSVTTIK